MYYSGFQSNAFQNNAFQIVGSVIPVITPISRGGFKKEREHNRSFTKSVKESLRELLDDPVAVEQVKDIVAPYSNSKSITASSIDFRLLAQNVEAAQRLIALAQEFQQEKDDEIAIMLLM